MKRVRIYASVLLSLLLAGLAVWLLKMPDYEEPKAETVSSARPPLVIPGGGSAAAPAGTPAPAAQPAGIPAHEVERFIRLVSNGAYHGGLLRTFNTLDDIFCQNSGIDPAALHQIATSLLEIAKEAKEWTGENLREFVPAPGWAAWDGTPLITGVILPRTPEEMSMRWEERLKAAIFGSMPGDPRAPILLEGIMVSVRSSAIFRDFGRAEGRYYFAAVRYNKRGNPQRTMVRYERTGSADSEVLRAGGMEQPPLPSELKEQLHLVPAEGGVSHVRMNKPR